MTKPLEGRVAIVTGAGQGLGREHALRLARDGAAVVVNDLGSSLSGSGRDSGLAEQVAAEIRAAGGEAVADGSDVADWEGAESLVRAAIENFGSLHVLLNNAGILRDRTVANLSESEWDDVIRVHLKGHMAPLRHAFAYWRQQAKEGNPLKASVIHTTSIAGFTGNFGQVSYSTAKAGIIGMSQVAHLEGQAYGIRSNAVSPSARTRLGLTGPGADLMASPENETVFDYYNPANVSPLIAWLAQENCPASGQVFHLGGNRLLVMTLPGVAHTLKTSGQWTLDQLDEALPGRLLRVPSVEEYLS